MSAENLIFSMVPGEKEKFELLTHSPADLLHNSTGDGSEIHHYLSNQAMISVEKRG